MRPFKTSSPQVAALSPSTIPTVALTIAGSDSGGGAGMQGDLRTFHQWGVHGVAAVTAATAQNTVGVQSIHAMEPRMVAAQIESVAADLAPRAVKSGMLATAGVAAAVASSLRRRRLGPYVLDPVTVSTSGDALLAPDAVAELKSGLLPLAAVVTPNLAEAALLTGLEVADPRQMAKAARALVEEGAGAALVTGGHLPGGEVLDVFWDGETERVHRGPRLGTGEVHGGGCALSAAIAAALARGVPVREAVGAAVRWVRSAIATAPDLGAGSRPVNHFAPPPPLPQCRQSPR